jgi:hypothetical protein
VQQVYIDGMASDPDVPLSLEGGPGERQEEVRDVLPITTRAVAAPAVLDLDSMITDLEQVRAARRGEPS